jgi:hypothetical protein
MTINNYDIDQYAEWAVILDGFDDAIIGIVQECCGGPRILYSKSKILDILCERDLMLFSEAEEYFDYNILNLYVDEQNPVFLIS